MRLTTKTEYTILALIYIARNSDKEFIKIESICREYDIPKKYLEHLLFVLKQNRILKTKRGAQGGYSLTRKPSDISVAEIIRLMDGALAPVESVSKYFYTQTPLEKEKKVLGIFREIRDKVSSILERKKLSDLL